MAYVTYSIQQYLQSKTSNADRIIAIDKLIDAMLLQMIDSVGDSGTKEYLLDDGQIKISTTYRGIDEIKNSINSLEQLKQIYVNRCVGRVTRLQDEKTLRR